MTTRTAVAVDRLAPWAVRYALGRQTYAVGIVVETLVGCVDALSADTRRAIVEDIDDALRRDRAGADMDRRDWLRLRDRLERGE